MAKLTGWNTVEKDLRKYCQNYMRHLATIVGQELVEKARETIEDFYKDYPSPSSYRRHYWNLRENSFRRYYSNKHGGNTYVAGVIFTPETMADIYRATPTQVLNSVLDGFHGLPYDHTINKKTGELKSPPVAYGYQTSPVPRMEPSPLDILTDFRDDILDNRMGEFSDRANQIAMKDKYTLIN